MEIIYMTACYECEKQVLEINKNSRCLKCVTRHNDVNAKIAEECLSTMAALQHRIEIIRNKARK